MIKAIIFDLNGVFLQAEYLTKRVEKKYGIPGEKLLPILKEVMAIARKPGIEDSFALWRPKLKKIGFNIDREEFFNFWFSGEKLVPKLIDYTKKLKERGLKVFILSNNFKERTKYYRKNFPEIFSSVDKVYFSWETGFVKPDPKAYLNILREQRLRPEECLYFDDSEENIKSAQKLGIRAIKYISFLETKKIIETYLTT